MPGINTLTYLIAQERIKTFVFLDTGCLKLSSSRLQLWLVFDNHAFSVDVKFTHFTNRPLSYDTISFIPLAMWKDRVYSTLHQLARYHEITDWLE